MQASDVISYTRFLLAEPAGSARFQDTDLLTCLNVAQQTLMLDLCWPEAIVTATMSQQEIPLPPVVQVRSASLGGQLLVPTTLARLEGVPLRTFDETAQNFATQWQAAPAAAYPLSNVQLGGPTTAGLSSYIPGQRPVYYLRGGFIGVVPAPAAGATLTLRIVPMPADLTDTTNVLFWPSMFKRCLACHMVAQCVEADTSDTSPGDSQVWHDRYKNAYGRLASWTRTMLVNLDTTPQFATYRARFKSPVPNTTSRAF